MGGRWHAALNALALDGYGGAAAIAIGGLLYFMGGEYGIFLVACMVYFFVVATSVTHVGMRRKRLMKGYARRGVQNVLANGLPALAMGSLMLAARLAAMPALEVIALIGFVSAVAAVTADTVESEIGVLLGRPRLLATLRKVKAGDSGGVTVGGLAAGAGAALMISLAVLPVYSMLARAQPAWHAAVLPELVLIIIIAGFAGSIIDSLLGYYEEKGIGSKFTTNIACGLGGALVGIALAALLLH